MKFALFMFDEFYPGGGWDDFKGVFATREKALEEAATNGHKFAQIVNLETLEIVFRNDQ